MANCKILFFFLALCIWCGKCDVIYKQVGDEVSMKCGVGSDGYIEWKLNGFLILTIDGRRGTRRKGVSHIASKVHTTGDTLKVPRLETRDAGVYSCTQSGKQYTLHIVSGPQTKDVNVSKGDDIELPCSLPQNVSQRVVGGKWRADHLPTVSFPTLMNTASEGLHWNGEDSSKVNFTTGQLSTNFAVMLKNVQNSDEGTFVCTVEFEGGVSLSVETTLRVVAKPSGCGLEMLVGPNKEGGGTPCKPQPEIAKIVEEILGLASLSICGTAEAPALLKLKELKRCMDDAGASPSDASSPVSTQDISPYPPVEPSPSQDPGFAQSTAPEDDIESLERKKLNLQIKLLEIQNEYYSLKLKKVKE